MASDVKWWRHHRPPFSGFKFCLQSGAEAFGATVLVNTGVTGIETDSRGLRNGKNSGAAAINVAVLFGVSRVLLLGYDMGYDKGQPSHFFGDHPKGLRADSPYLAFIEIFALMVEPLRALGVQVVNCSRQTRLTCFDRQPLRQALPDAGHSRPVLPSHGQAHVMSGGL